MNRFLIVSLAAIAFVSVSFADSAAPVPALPFKSIIRRGDTITVTFLGEERHAHIGLNAPGYPQMAEPGQTLTLKSGDTLNIFCERHGAWTFALKPRFDPLPAGIAGVATYNSNGWGNDLRKIKPIRTVPVFRRAKDE